MQLHEVECVRQTLSYDTPRIRVMNTELIVVANNVLLFLLQKVIVIRQLEQCFGEARFRDEAKGGQARGVSHFKAQ